jgi:hypothetical protein
VGVVEQPVDGCGGQGLRQWIEESASRQRSSVLAEETLSATAAELRPLVEAAWGTLDEAQRLGATLARLSFELECRGLRLEPAPIPPAGDFEGARVERIRTDIEGRVAASWNGPAT